jgi:hypothetical protein
VLDEEGALELLQQPLQSASQDSLQWAAAETLRNAGVVALQAGRRDLFARLEPVLLRLLGGGSAQGLQKLRRRAAEEVPRMQAAAAVLAAPASACANCGAAAGAPGVRLKRCSRCGRAWYCDAQCQRAHWRRHKAECKG